MVNRGYDWVDAKLTHYLGGVRVAKLKQEEYAAVACRRVGNVRRTWLVLLVCSVGMIAQTPPERP